MEHAQEIRRSFEQYAQLQQNFPSSKRLFVKFEHLIDKSKRIAALRKMATFIVAGSIADSKLAAAFRHSEVFHRKSNHNGSVQVQQVWSPALLDKVWITIGTSAASFGYEPPPQHGGRRYQYQPPPQRWYHQSNPNCDKMETGSYRSFKTLIRLCSRA